MKFLAKMLLCLMISFSLVEFPIMKAQAYAGMITTTEAVADFTRTQGDAKVAQFLNRTDVQDQLVKLGVDPQEASRRIAGLSDAEVKKLTTDIDKATLGGDVGGILIIVLLVLLIIYLAKRI